MHHRGETQDNVRLQEGVVCTGHQLAPHVNPRATSNGTISTNTKKQNTRTQILYAFTLQIVRRSFPTIWKHTNFAFCMPCAFSKGDQCVHKYPTPLSILCAHGSHYNKHKNIQFNQNVVALKTCRLYLHGNKCGVTNQWMWYADQSMDVVC